MDRDLENLASIAVDCGFRLHETLGPGLLESVYEACLFQLLTERGLAVRRQQSVPIHFNGLILQEGFRADLLVEDQLLIELKSTEAHAPVHAKQVLTYLRLLDLKLGLLMNFGAGRFKDGIRRIAKDYYRGQPFP